MYQISDIKFTYKDLCDYLAHMIKYRDPITEKYKGEGLNFRSIIEITQNKPYNILSHYKSDNIKYLRMYITNHFLDIRYDNFELYMKNRIHITRKKKINKIFKNIKQ